MSRKWFVLGAAAVIAAFFGLFPGKSRLMAPLPEKESNKSIIASLPPATNALAFKNWISRWRDESRTASQTLLAEGRQLAVARHDSMYRLIQENSERALAESLTWSEWAALPEELRLLVETPFSDLVDFQVLPSCAPREGAVNNVHPHQVILHGKEREAYVFGRKTTVSSKEEFPMRGIFLGNRVALAESAFEWVGGDDLRAAEEIFPYGHRRGVSWLSGEAVGERARTILLGGSLYELGSVEEEGALADLFLAAEKSLHPKAVLMAMAAGASKAGGSVAFDMEGAKKQVALANSSWTEAGKKTLVMRLSYSDAPNTFSYTVAELNSLMITASNYVRTMSYGKTWIEPKVVTVTYPEAYSYYNEEGPNRLKTHANQALQPLGESVTNYDFVVYAHLGHSGPGFSYGGLGEIGSGASWINGRAGIDIIVHELGHNYGLGHAHYWAGLTGMGALGRKQANGIQMESEEYGDPFDVMAVGSLPSAHFGAHGKAALNWIERSDYIEVVTNGIYRVSRHDHREARANPNRKLALKIVAPGGEEYWVSHRRLFSANPSLARGANIVRADSVREQSLVDTTPLSKASSLYATDREDSGLMVGKSFTDTLGTVRITTIAAAGTAPQEYLDVQVVFPDTGAFSLYADKDFLTNGLVGSYINANLRGRSRQHDWRIDPEITVAGRRVDPRLNFTSDGWGARAELGLQGGSDANWDNFSVQWDGFLAVRRPIRLSTTSDDSSRFWIDLDHDGEFGILAPEWVNNHWGFSQGPTRGEFSSVIPPGVYRIRIQYEEGVGGNYFTLDGTETHFQVFTDAALETPGLKASFVNRSLRDEPAQVDWRVTEEISGSRIDEYPGFLTDGWGSLDSVGLSVGVNGVDSDWDNFSTQWDGFLTNSAPLKMATISDDHSRMWIDLNGDGNFSSGQGEFLNNGWGGGGQEFTIGNVSGVIPPGSYAIRIQYEEGEIVNNFLLAGAPQPPVDAAPIFTTLTFTGAEVRHTPRRIAADFTIQFWMRSAQVAGDEETWLDGMSLVEAYAADTPRSFGISLGKGRILFGVGSSPHYTIRSAWVADGAWHHVSARRVQSTGALSLFIDGTLVAEGVATSELLDAVTTLALGRREDGSHGFVGTMEQPRFWDAARSDEQIVADFHSTRAGRVGDDTPVVHIARSSPESVQVFWDALSSYRFLEGATEVDGEFTLLPTDQNSTNIVFGPNMMRFFRVRK